MDKLRAITATEWLLLTVIVILLAGHIVQHNAIEQLEKQVSLNLDSIDYLDQLGTMRGEKIDQLHGLRSR